MGKKKHTPHQPKPWRNGKPPKRGQYPRPPLVNRPPRLQTGEEPTRS